ncbi:ornithine cyclodeaminase family protein [Stenotrophomonas sp. 24(2023)]|uniref:ornithine cyclodeaminase family protein n=1 Tax=Stenotrophomonas sp. 24(2023) TaxID=3068324 RepID=UPI0027E1E349|nr:ornithine cyclodeaminase family protein [Stenotrophomonas sp. 24(2023)]WMJ69293.1 ornithine cyclodeaminase family protein [Stenotrophomonas sp. 24(2023)]
MIHLSEARTAALVNRALAFTAATEAMIALASPTTTCFPVVQGHGLHEGERFGLKSGTTATATGVKIGSYWPGNPERGLPRHASSIVLLDPLTGRLKAVIEAAEANAFRTAAADAVAAHALARADARHLAIFGTGHQALHEVLAIAAVRPLQRVHVVGRDPQRSEAFAARLRDAGLDARTTDAETACRAADIIVTATTARQPLFDAGWVQPGTHIASMGSDAVGKQELPVALHAQARLFCDLPAQSRVIGEFQHAPAGADLTALGEVLTGHARGRASATDITVFDSSGTAIQDLLLAEALLAADAADPARR